MLFEYYYLFISTYYGYQANTTAVVLFEYEVSYEVDLLLFRPAVAFVPCTILQAYRMVRKISTDRFYKMHGTPGGTMRDPELTGYQHEGVHV